MPQLGSLLVNCDKLSIHLQLVIGYHLLLILLRRVQLRLKRFEPSLPVLEVQDLIFGVLKILLEDGNILLTFGTTFGKNILVAGDLCHLNSLTQHQTCWSVCVV